MQSWKRKLVSVEYEKLIYQLFICCFNFLKNSLLLSEDDLGTSITSNGDSSTESINTPAESVVSSQNALSSMEISDGDPLLFEGRKFFYVDYSNPSFRFEPSEIISHALQEAAKQEKEKTTSTDTMMKNPLPPLPITARETTTYDPNNSLLEALSRATSTATQNVQANQANSLSDYLLTPTPIEEMKRKFSNNEKVKPSSTALPFLSSLNEIPDDVFDC